MIQTIDQQLHQLMSDLNLIYADINKKILSQHGLRSVRYFVMQHLFQNPDATLGELSDLALVDRASLSRMVYSMEKQGLVLRKPNAADRRIFMLSLTKEGQAVYETVQADMDADIERRFGAIDQKTKVNLVTLNQQIKDILTSHVDTLSDPPV